MTRFHRMLAAATLGLGLAQQAGAQTVLLNVSCDVMRDFYKDYNPAFVKHWKDSTGESVNIQSSFGGSSKQARAQEFVTQLFRNVPVLDAGGRGATTTFIQRNIGDVLVTFENEAELIAKEFGRGQFEVIYPSLSLAAEPPVSVVDRVVDKKGTRKVAQAYLDYLYSPAGQEIAAQNYLRPRDAAVFKRDEAQFPAIRLLGISDAFGSLAAAQKQHFDDGGVFDKIYLGGKR